jgi:hypothetical protein
MRSTASDLPLQPGKDADTSVNCQTVKGPVAHVYASNLTSMLDVFEVVWAEELNKLGLQSNFEGPERSPLRWVLEAKRRRHVLLVPAGEQGVEHESCRLADLNNDRFIGLVDRCLVHRSLLSTATSLEMLASHDFASPQRLP